VELNRRGWLPAPFSETISTNHFAAISLAFTALLVIETVSLILALARSVAASMGAQLELFSLILLREAFKELGDLPEPIVWETARDSVLHALADGAGALLVFIGVIVYNQLQRHRTITADADDLQRFVQAKKAIALGLIVAFIIAGVEDAWRIVTQNDPYPFFDAFFTALIFADILIVLVSLRYTDTYAVVFRNAGFALATVILRLALVAPPYVNVLLGLGATLFMIGLTLAYNRAPIFVRELELEK
ncbi:MAG: hypothetical protein AAGI08_00445, partial [Bacteroidota bacterium]